MLTKTEAGAAVEAKYDGVSIEDCVVYKDNYLVRVAYPSPEERNYDPFFLVDSKTGAVQEFSIMTDGDPGEIAEAFANG